MNPRDGAPWTPAEDALVAELLTPKSRRRVPLDWPRILAALPGRTKAAIRQRRRATGVAPLAPARHWSAAEDRLLAACWQEDGKRTLLAKLPGRSWEAIYTRAGDLGMASIPQGWVTFQAEARRCGFDRAQAVRVVAWSRAWAPLVESLCQWGYQMARMMGAPAEHVPEGYDGGAVVTRLHTTSCSKKRAPSRRWTLVEEGTLEPAFGRWQSWETSAQAGARRDVLPPLMLRWALNHFGLPRTGGAHLRLPRAWWDAASSHLQSGGRSLSDHARRCGVHRCYLERAIRFAGVQPNGGRRACLSDAQVDAALAAYASRPGTVRATPKGAAARRSA